MRILAPILGIGLLAMPASSEILREPVHGFRYQRVEGWYPVLEQALEAPQPSGAITGVPPENDVLGFSRQPGGQLQLPFVRVAVARRDFKKATVDDVRKAFAVVGRSIREPEIRRLDVATLVVDGPRLDLPRRRILFQEQHQQNENAIHVLGVILLGKDRTVSVTCHVAKENWINELPGCRSWIDGFKLDPEKIWEPLGGTGEFVGAARTALQTALLGGTAVLGVIVMIMMWRRRKAGVDQVLPTKDASLD